jgi:Leucine-rich repeat (LRR) protein
MCVPTLSSGVQVLDLSRNFVRVVKTDLLENQGQLTSLVLANNKIGKIEAGAFRDLQNVSSVNMDNNLGDIIPEVLRELLSLPNLQRLSLRNENFS